MVEWMDFICRDKEPAILVAERSGSGITPGREYQCWDVEKGKYRIWNDADNCVLAAKGYFKVKTSGDVNL